MPHSASDLPLNELWFVDIAAAAPALHAFEARHRLLNDAEHQRAAALRDDAMRNEWLAAHIALRVVIGSVGGPDLARQSFAVTEHGKPFLAQSRYTFSLSHAPGVALIGLSTASAIGVDIERHREVRIGEYRRASIIAAARHLSSDALPEDTAARFLQAWVRIEALAKADGCGVGRMLTRLGVRGRPPPPSAGAIDDGTAKAILIASRARDALRPTDDAADLTDEPNGAVAAPDGISERRGGLTVTDLAAGDGLYAAVALQGGAAPNVCQRFPESLEGLEKLFK